MRTNPAIVTLNDTRLVELSRTGNRDPADVAAGPALGLCQITPNMLRAARDRRQEQP